MKKKVLCLASAVVMILGLLITGCKGKTETPVSSSEESQINSAGFSLPPSVSADSLTNEEKKKMLNSLKEAGEPRRGVSYYAYEHTWNEDGSLTVKGFIRNNSGETVSDIKGDFEIVFGGKTIAKTNLTLSEKEFGAIENKDNRPWTLKFKSSEVSEKPEEMDSFSVKVSVDYTIK